MTPTTNYNLPSTGNGSEPAASQSWTGNNVAIVHDWLYGGGAERVVQQLHKLYPDAPIYTGSTTGEWRQKLGDQVITGWPNWWPLRKLRKYMALPLGWWFRSLDLSEYDLIIVSTGNGEAKQIKKTGDATVICYCHTPVHFYWRHYQQYVDAPGFGVFNPLARIGLKTLVKPLRKRDYRAAQSINHWVANSSAIKADIKQFYDKDAQVVYPPVATSRFSPTEQVGDYFVTIGRLVPYKRVDIVIEACEQLSQPLKVVGRGPELASLQKLTGDNSEIITDASDEDVAAYLADASGFIFAAYEDFGITPVESLAAGTPVVAYGKGGALDYITDQTGVLFEEQSVPSLKKALGHFNPDDFDSQRLRQAAVKFNPSRFRAQFSELVSAILHNK